MNFKHPSLSFDLPEWHESHFNQIRAAEKKLYKIVSSVGTNSDKFNTALSKMSYRVLKERVTDPVKLLSSSFEVRVFAYLLANNAQFAKGLKLSEAAFDHVQRLRSPVSRLSLTQFIRAFIIHFDLFVDVQVLSSWSKFIQSQLTTMSGKGSNQLMVFRENKALLFSPYAPSLIVKKAVQEKVDFDWLIEKLGLTGYNDSRFLQICQFHYYLASLKSLAVGEDHPILSEVVKTHVVNSLYEENKLLGHAILEILIDRSKSGEVSPAWQRAVLEIAGDPRVPESSPRYQQWWSILGHQRIAKVRGWLSQFDLKLFLEVLEQSALDSGNKDMERMFSDRKVFMEGLLKQGVVVHSRLFLSKTAENYLKRSYRKQELPEYAFVKGSQTSVIYLNLSGKVHMIEGSHSFKLKFMDALPKDLNIDNYAKTSFEDYTLRMRPLHYYEHEFGELGNSDKEGFVEFAHHTQLSWQHKAIEYLKKQKINLDVSKLIPRDKYRLYKEKFGVGL